MIAKIIGGNALLIYVRALFECPDLLIRLIEIKLKTLVLRFKLFFAERSIRKKDILLRDRLIRIEQLAIKGRELVSGKGEPLLEDGGGHAIADELYERCDGIDVHGFLAANSLIEQRAA